MIGIAIGVAVTALALIALAALAVYYKAGATKYHLFKRRIHPSQENIESNEDDDFFADFQDDSLPPRSTTLSLLEIETDC